MNDYTQTAQLVAVMNSFNRLALLKEALPNLLSVLEKTPIQSVVVVVDAGSIDGSVEFVEALSQADKEPRVWCIKADKSRHLSFSEGCNLALEFASEHWRELQWGLFFETDNLFRNPLAISSALDFLQKHGDVGAVGFRVQRRNELPEGFGTRFPSLLQFWLGQRLASAFGLDSPRLTWMFNGDRWSYCDIVYTSPLLVRLETWHATRGMDATNFPFGDSDSDWCWTARRLGWRCAVLDVPGVVHDNNALSSAWSATRVLNFHQARFRLLVKQRGASASALKGVLFIRHAIECMLLIPAALFSRTGRWKLKQRLHLLVSVRNGYAIKTS